MMFEQIARDAETGRFDDWALSTVIDENVQSPVISKAEFLRLHAAAGLAATWPIGNAGLLHVYGYLLSTVVTPFGLKGDRWRNGELAGHFSLAPTAFLLDAADAGGQTVLERVTDAALPHLANPAGSRGDVLVIDDEVPGEATFFRTTVVSAPGQPGAALIYGVSEGDRMRVVTAFPLAHPTPASLDALAAEPPRMRYNAALTALPPLTALRRRP
ncbi:amino acid deaminase [Cryobacterium sp. LW097]|uniref:amino acid deaminase n=1 Tax=unclassified Cryobacterium TaxID=2649013 RepID=UPI000B4D50CB|nr:MULTISPECIES: amino acid deaminase [unclassified Cryobacterium]ASD23362.1 amino acid deaminase [Cryobacterium sp. LW097]TFC56703.1 amino acid deaminase [Cryobacterium sp. TMB3-1-2]TFC72209.1 amino acid deaminase [Cryobacterium sp. TMB3-15]TFC78832.1 amino acid deaminase [Cryobacterium sp. TMB3-10]TFD38625.1 amino acid deaminase [Cryobacterium sp. TMB3-12]